MNPDRSRGHHPRVLISPTIRPQRTIQLDSAFTRTIETEHRWNWRNLSELFWNIIPRPDIIKDARTEKPIVVDCWKYGEDLREPCISHISYIDDGNIESWATQPAPTQEGKSPRAGIRLLHICSDRSPFPKDIINVLAKAFGIPRVQLSVSSLRSGVCARICDPDTNHPVFVCRAPISDMAVTSVVKYNPQTNVTTGYILSSSESEIHLSLVAIPTQFDLCEHPLLVPVLLTEHSLEVVSGHLHSIKDRLEDVEWRAGVTTLVEEKGAYHSDTAIWLGALTRTYARCRALMQAATLRDAFLAEQLRTIDTWMPTARLQASQKSTSLLMERIAYIRSNLEHLNVDSGIELRIDALKTLIFNLTAQQDNQMNIQISRDMKRIAIKAKKDGGTMKLVAILGAIFLPSTFVSTFFSMPFFNWNAPSASEVAGHYFWLYWAVTGPLTLCTIVLVWAWILLRNGPNSDNDDKGDPQPRPKSGSGQSDSKNVPDTSGDLRPWHVRFKDGSRHPSHLYDRFGKAVQSLGRRNRYTTPANENRESYARFKVP